jgi:hypothetical protein
MRRDLERRLARAETMAPAISWLDRQAAYHRRSLRAYVKLCQLIQEHALVIAVGPSLAEAFRRGEEKTAELAAIPDNTRAGTR